MALAFIPQRARGCKRWWRSWKETVCEHNEPVQLTNGPQKVNRFKNIEVEFYIISGGLQAIMQGNAIVNKYFCGVYGCQLAEDPNTGLIAYIKRSITFTEKSRYIFEINKGIKQTDSEFNPFS